MLNFGARVLIDTGASHSFIASSFTLALELEIEVLDLVLLLDTPIRGRSTLRRVYRFELDMTSFDAILGMDWLTSYCATIYYFQHRVNFCTPECDRFYFMGDRGCSITPSFTDVRRQG